MTTSNTLIVNHLRSLVYYLHWKIEPSILKVLLGIWEQITVSEDTGNHNTEPVNNRSEVKDAG